MDSCHQHKDTGRAGDFARSMILRRLEGRFSEVVRVWEGETVAIIGGGPSLTQEDVDRCKAFKTIAINNAYLLAPWADVLYFADPRWWGWHKDRPEFKAFRGLKVTIEPTCSEVPDDIYALKNWDYIGGFRDGLCLEPTGLTTGRNSGYQGLNLAVLAGAKRILLLAFDMRFKDGDSHCRLNHEGGHHPIKNNENEFRAYAQKFSTTEHQLKNAGVEVINTSLNSKLETFRKESLESVVANQGTAAVPA